MSLHVSFIVDGIPVQQGSKNLATNKHTGKTVMLEAAGKSLKTWRHIVAFKAREAMSGQAKSTGAIYLELAFRFPRPRGHFGTGRNVGKLKPSAPNYRTTTPDLDKLTRAVGDALTGVVYKDDAQVVQQILSKSYADDLPPGVTVTAIELGK